MATPNSEQKLAIEHHGGVLLKAGAGSGKTFVLKEHMVYLVRSWIESYKQEKPIEDFASFIKAKLRRIVLMTFTNKAAGELEIRLIKEFKAVLEMTESDQEMWQVVIDQLAYLNVSTIHGFCFKLIKLGLIKDVSADDKILSETEFKDQIENIFEQWIFQNSDNDDEIFQIVLKDKSSLLDAVIKIFSDPSLRDQWANLETSNIHSSEVESVCQDLMNFYGFDLLIQEKPSLARYSDFNDKKWFIFLENFLSKLNRLDYSGLLSQIEFFEELNYKIPVKPSIKTVPEELVEYYERIKAFKDFLKKNGEHFQKFNELYDQKVSPWFETIRSLVSFIEKSYRNKPGLTFSDLEYYVLKGLEISEVVEQINEQFNYFIVDEFQDTSYLQFAIIRKILKDDFSKLFCVGDLKQAIYGFRGGELGVFKDCAKLIPTNLTLNNNYRSSGNIIRFNNEFFDFTFGLGHNFKGSDSQKVQVDYQLDPGVEANPGSINEIQVSLDFLNQEEKVSNAEIDYYEALGLFEQIKNNLNDNQQTAVLYKRLKPSLLLLDLLIKNNIGFTAQLKIPFLEDPIVGLFYTLIENEFDHNEKKSEFRVYLINSYLKLIGSTQNFEEKDIENFHRYASSYGYYSSYLNLLERFEIATANYKNNLLSIRDQVFNSGQNIRAVYLALKALGENSFSSDFKFGENSDQIILMTAHASKGLEFEHVLIGGIYTNENSVMSQSTIGKIPFSFKWQESIYGKKRFKTPHLMLEEEISKRKDFSESKRLFYVANTRAKNYLSYVNLDFANLKRSKSQSGHWFKAIEIYKSKKEIESLSTIQVDIENKIDKLYRDQLQTKPSLIHIDNLGCKISESKKQSILLPELSVTRIASFLNCPRKFYLANICKISKEDLDLLDFESNAAFDFDLEIDDQLSSKNIIKSGAGRGSYFHEEISKKIIAQDFSPLSNNHFNVKKSVDWTVSKLELYVEKFALESEKPIKFELFGYMISGIPDLVCFSNDSETPSEIWDFKTGSSQKADLESYFFQLYCYAYALYSNNRFYKNKSIRILLCFSDEQKIVDKILSFSDVENYLYEVFCKLNQVDQVNTEHCDSCQFNQICIKKS